MEQNQTAERPSVCPECGAAFSGEGTYCWLCGWKLGDPVGIRPKGPQKINPYVSPALKPGDLKWTFSLSTLFLWTALVAVVMGVVRIAPGLGIALGIICIPAALHTTAVVAKRERRTGTRLTVQEKIERFFLSFALVVVIASGSGVAAFGAFFVTCTAGMFAGARFFHGANDLSFLSISAFVAGAVFVSLVAFFLIRNVRRTKD